MATRHLFLHDNSTTTVSDAGGDRSSLGDLISIAGKDLKSLVSLGVLFIPPSLSDIEYAEDSGPLITLEGAYGDAYPDEVKVTTGNLMGFLSVGDTEVSITSRFTDKREKDYFLQYMLSRTFHINIIDSGHTYTSDGFFDIFVLLFPGLLKEALRKGVYRAYTRNEYNSSSPRGAVDMKRHLRDNIPFLGRTAYTAREYTYDNSVTELVRHTIEYIERSSPFRSILISDNETKESVRIIRECTPSYKLQKRLSVIKANRKKVLHPYFMEYGPLQKLCLLILGREKISYAISDESISGIIFDGAWLWEEYLARVLSESSLGFTHSSNIRKEGGLDIYSRYRLYPDYYKRRGEKTEDAPYNTVLDAKYRRLDTSFGRDNLLQLVTYMHMLPSLRGALISPVESTSEALEVQKTKSAKLTGYGGEVALYNFPVPQSCSSPDDFEARMRHAERSLIAALTAFENTSTTPSP